jgi:putative membrane protein
MEARGHVGDESASRRTRLANERTLLAWWRSGLTATGVGLAVGRVLPEVGHQAQWPYSALGCLYAVLGVAMVIYGTARQRQVERGLESGGFPAPAHELITVFTTLAVGISLATLALIVVDT